MTCKFLQYIFYNAWCKTYYTCRPNYTWHTLHINVELQINHHIPKCTFLVLRCKQEHYTAFDNYDIMILLLCDCDCSTIAQQARQPRSPYMYLQSDYRTIQQIIPKR